MERKPVHTRVHLDDTPLRILVILTNRKTQMLGHLTASITMDGKSRNVTVNLVRYWILSYLWHSTAMKLLLMSSKLGRNSLSQDLLAGIEQKENSFPPPLSYLQVQKKP